MDKISSGKIRMSLALLILLLLVSGIHWIVKNRAAIPETQKTNPPVSGQVITLSKGQSQQAGTLTLTFLSENSVTPPVQPPGGPEILPETEYYLEVKLKDGKTENIKLQSSNSQRIVGGYIISFIKENMEHSEITLEIKEKQNI